MAAAPANENFEQVTATEGSNNAASLTVNTLSYATNGSGTVETYAVSPYWGVTSANHTGKAIIANYNGALDNAITTFRFGSVNTANKFQLNSLSAFANEIVSSYSYSVIFNVQGYSGGIGGTLVVSTNQIDMRTSNTYGTGNAAVIYSRDGSVASNAGNVGTLTFGSAWTNIDTVVFTAADSKPLQLSLDTLVFSTPTPTVTSISPSSGSMAGGTAVTITGTGFTGASSVTIGGAAVASFSVSNDTTISATTAAHAAGAGLSVLVTSPGGTNVANTLFTYLSNDANLSALTTTAGTLSPSFAPATTAYTATVLNGVSGITVTATQEDANATLQVQVNGAGFNSLPSGSPSGNLVLGVGSNTVNVKVTAQDGTTSKTYTITVLRGSAFGSFIDTTQAQFQAGTSTNLDSATTPGDLTLYTGTVDQQNTSVTGSGFGFTSTSWAGQTFTPSVTGTVPRIDLDLFTSSVTGTTPNITVSIRATSGSTPVPTGPDLATATIPGFNNAAGAYYSAFFASPPTLTAGTTYAVIFRAVSNPSAGTYAYTGSILPNSNPYTSGQRVTSTNSGSGWTADTTSGGRDIGFMVYVSNSGGAYALSGDIISTIKDSAPVTGLSPIWTSLGWTAESPVGSSVKFQVAASNSASGPYSFVGPDGTAATYFTTSGASLSQFNGLRYLEYRAFLSSTNGMATPVVHDVTVNYNVPAIVPTVDLATGIIPLNTTTLTITGTNFDPTAGNNTVTFSPSGTGTVTAASPTSLTVTGITGLSSGVLNAVVTVNTVSNAAPVQVATVSPPTISSISSTTANGSYNATTLIPITVTFSAPVTVTGTPTLALNSGGSASFASGSGTATLTFNYTVGSTDNATLLDCSSTTALALAGGTISATTGGTAATLTLPTPGGANSLGTNKAIVIDTTPPTIVSINRLTPTGQTTASNTVTFRVTYSEAVTVPGTSNFAVVAVNGSSIVGTVTGVTGTGTTRDVTVSITSGTGEFRLRAVN